jgi:hypothetical protein
MKAVLHEDAVFITILRDPVCLIESLFCYSRIEMKKHERFCTNSTIRFFANWPNSSYPGHLTLKRVGGKVGFNQMSFDLGFDPTNFDNSDMIKAFVKQIDLQFHLVMILDRIDESLILMQELLCLPLEDVLVFKHNARLGSEKCILPSNIKKKIRMLNAADQILYDFFLTKLEHQIDKFGRSKMKKRVALLQNATQMIYNKCVVNKELKENLPPVSQVSRLQPKANVDQLCKELTMAELPFTDLLRKQAKLKCMETEMS